jgi:hypothetical protein
MRYSIKKLYGRTCAFCTRRSAIEYHIAIDGKVIPHDAGWVASVCPCGHKEGDRELMTATIEGDHSTVISLTDAALAEFVPA